MFEVKNAKVPILKIKYRDQLNLDVSLGIGNIEVIDASLPISMMSPHDQETESVIQPHRTQVIIFNRICKIIMTLSV